MAKKNEVTFGIAYAEPTVYDNRGLGVMDKPNDSLHGCRYPKGKMQFVDAIAKGESAERPDALLETANGSQRSQGQNPAQRSQGQNPAQRSQGQNPAQQSNWSPSSAWSEDKEWDGGNMTGM